MAQAALSRAARKAQTRREILRAAERLFATRGIAATSVDRIATEIGLTSGAVYAHFPNKTALIDAVMERASLTVDPSEFLYREDLTLGQKLQLLAERFAGLRRRVTPQLVLLELESLLYELRNPRALKRRWSQEREFRREVGERIEASSKGQGGGQLPIPGPELVAVLTAVARGIVLELARDPEALSDKAINRLFELLAGEPPSG